jgi:O-Antigen ligase
MKYVVFGIALLFGVPVMTWLAMSSRRLREALVSLLLVSTCFGPFGKLNFVSLETYRGPDRGYEVTLTDLIALSLCLALLIGFRHKLKLLPPRTFLLAAFFLLCLVSTAMSPVPLYGSFTLFKLLRMFVLYWCLVNVLETGVRLEALWVGIISIAGIMTVLAIKQKYLNGMYRISGPFDHSNTIPLYVNVLLPVLLTWPVADRNMPKWKAIVSMLGVMGLLLSVVATYSRAGIALAGVSLVIVLIGVNARGANPRSITVSVLVLLLMIAGAIKAADSMMKRVKEAPKASEEAREEFNNAAHAMLQDHSGGVGLNNFSYVLTAQTDYHRFLHVMENETQAGVCHHIYNLTAAELGYPGLVMFIGILLSFWWTALRSSVRSRELEAKLLFGLMLGAMALHLQGFLEWGFRITPVMQIFAMSCAIVIGLSRRVSAGSAKSNLLPARRPQVLIQKAVAVCP